MTRSRTTTVTAAARISGDKAYSSEAQDSPLSASLGDTDDHSRKENEIDDTVFP